MRPLGAGGSLTALFASSLHGMNPHLRGCVRTLRIPTHDAMLR
jgi:hypothetical protein